MFYKVINRNGLKESGKSSNFYCAPKSMGVISLEDIAEVIEKRSALSAGDVMSVLENFINVAAESAQLGFSVQAGGLGTFVPTFKSGGVPNKEDCSGRLIHSVRLSFRASDKLRRKLNDTEFKEFK